MKKWLFLAIAIASEVTGSLCMKAALDHPWLYAVVGLGYLAAFSSVFLAMKAGMSLSVAYGIWGALGVALTALFSTMIFNEALTPTMLAGIVLVMLGVLLVDLGGTHANSAEPEGAK